MDVYIKKIEEAKNNCMQQETPIDLIPPPRVNPFVPLPAAIANNPLKKLLQSGGDFSQLNSLWRTKRAAGDGLLNPDENDLYDFLEQVRDHRSETINKMGNLSCVLIEMNMLTPDREINIEHYTTELTGEASSEGYDFEEEGTAVSDPEWRQKISDAYNDCYKISESFPESSLNKNPVTKRFGRHMIFFKCIDKAENHLCGEAQILQWLEKLYGAKEPEQLAEHLEKLELPEDKYDAAVLSLAVMMNAASDVENFVGDFFWGRGDH